MSRDCPDCAKAALDVAALEADLDTTRRRHEMCQSNLRSACSERDALSLEADDLRSALATAQHALANERQVSEGLRLRLTGEEREALDFVYQLVAELLHERRPGPAATDAQRNAWLAVSRHNAVLDKLLKETP